MANQEDTQNDDKFEMDSGIIWPQFFRMTKEESLKDRVELTGGDEDILLDAINKYLRKLAARQIKLAFDQSEKEVEDLRQRTREGIRTA